VYQSCYFIFTITFPRHSSNCRPHWWVQGDVRWVTKFATNRRNFLRYLDYSGYCHIRVCFHKLFLVAGKTSAHSYIRRCIFAKIDSDQHHIIIICTLAFINVHLCIFLDIPHFTVSAYVCQYMMTSSVYL
jgi:hypothetical protein